MEVIYLDNNATTRPRREVIDEMTSFLQERYANPSSLHSLAREARQALERSRERVAVVLGCTPEEIFFTSGGTEANNMALKGVAFSVASRRRKKIVTSSIEHSSVHNTARFLERQGFEVVWLPVDGEGVVIVEEAERAIDGDTLLVSVMAANNETGAIQPIAELTRLAHAAGALMHVDGVQLFGKAPFDPVGMGVDLLSLSAHKIYGPKGVGLLYKRRGVPLEPLLHGGGHERGMRSGTENGPGIAGMAVACELIAEEGPQGLWKRLERLRDRLEEGILEIVPDAVVHAKGSTRTPHTLYVAFPGWDGRRLADLLDEFGICVGTGSACSSANPEPSRILTAMGVDRDLAIATVRFSLGMYNRDEDIEYTLYALRRIMERRPPTSRGCPCDD